MHDMQYTTQPYQHQIEANERAWKQNAFAFFMEMGTGKSKIVVDEITNLILQEKLNCAIIAAPNNVHINWKEQFDIHGPADPPWLIQIYRSELLSKKRFVVFEEENRLIIQSGKVLIFLINIEALSTNKSATYLQRILRARRKSYFVIDESHKIKTPGAIRTKSAIVLGKQAMYRRI